MCAQCANFFTKFPFEEPQTHPFQTPSKLGHPSYPIWRQLQATFPSHKTSYKMEKAMNGDGRHPRHQTLDNMQASFCSIAAHYNMSNLCAQCDTSAEPSSGELGHIIVAN